MRTLAMSVTSAACAVMAVTWVAFILWAISIAGDGSGGGPIVVIGAVIATIFGVLALATASWKGSITRVAPWAIAAIVGLLVILLNAPYIPAALKNPGDTVSFVVGLIVVFSGLVVAIAGVAAALDVSRQGQTWSREGRAPLALVAVVAAVTGAAVTSVLAGSATGGGGKLAAAPTITGTVTAQNTKFGDSGLTITSGDVLGLFVINRDSSGHSFDIDSLGIHVSLAPNSATAVSVAPAAAGNLTYYCAIPGHREAGMVGTIVVQ